MTITDAARDAVRSPSFKFIVILFLILLLTIPLLFVYGLVWDREQTAKRAERSVSNSWAATQVVSGPYLIVPTETPREFKRGDTTETKVVRELVAFLPEDFNASSKLDVTRRQRGIFSIPVYQSTIAVSGRFSAPDWQRVVKSTDRVLWGEAELVVLISDVRGIKRSVTLTSGADTLTFRAGSGVSGGRVSGIHVPLDEARVKAGFPFEFDVVLNGSQGLSFVPVGGDSKVTIASDWPHPSFDGQFLPDTRAISDAGFTASWSIPRLARGQGQELRISSLQQLRSSKAFGVKLFQPVRFYSLAQRALKYALGFIAVAFLAVFVIEIQSRQRVHWIQYLFVGLSLVVFYILLVGTAEHIGFDRGYAAAATATSLLIAAYVGTVTSSATRGVAMLVVIGLIYALLYLLLRLEDFALLVGSIAAFVLIATVMFATRNVDWARGGFIGGPSGRLEDRSDGSPAAQQS